MAEKRYRREFLVTTREWSSKVRVECEDGFSSRTGLIRQATGKLRWAKGFQLDNVCIFLAQAYGSENFMVTRRV